MPSRHLVEHLPASTLRVNPRNARTHSKHQIRQIASSIREFGFVNPVLIDEAGMVIAGHGRLSAAKLLDLESVPAIRLENLTKTQKRALALADNKLAENGGWNEEFLAQELQFLTEIEVDFDVTITGFETAEIDLLIESLDPKDSDPKADEIPEMMPARNVIVHYRDLWKLGSHRLLCGDAMKPESFERLMVGKKAQLVFTDPPYNLRIDGHVGGSGAIKHEEFAMASGEMSEAEFTAFLERSFSNLAMHSADGSIHFIFMDWRHLIEALTAGRCAYAELKNLCVWNKSNGGMGSFYRSKHELVLVFKNGTAPHINNIELGRHGRNRTNVWNYSGVNSLRNGRLEELKMHPTVKPAALVADAIQDCSRRNGLVLDCFAGSGTTLIAAERMGRRCYAMEIDPRYVETAIRRWQDYTGEDAVHAETGLTLVDLGRRRAPIQETETIQSKVEPSFGSPIVQEAGDVR